MELGKTMASGWWTVTSRDDIRAAFGVRLRDIRLRMRLKQEYCAMAVGVSHRQWCRWEKGVCLPTPIAWRSLTSVFPQLYDKCPTMSYEGYGIN